MTQIARPGRLETAGRSLRACHACGMVLVQLKTETHPSRCGGDDRPKRSRVGPVSDRPTLEAGARYGANSNTYANRSCRQSGSPCRRSEQLPDRRELDAARRSSARRLCKAMRDRLPRSPDMDLPARCLRVVVYDAPRSLPPSRGVRRVRSTTRQTGKHMNDNDLGYEVGTTSMAAWRNHIMDDGASEQYRRDWDGCRPHCLVGTIDVASWSPDGGLVRYATFHDEACPNRGWRVMYNEQGAHRVRGGDGSIQAADDAGLFGPPGA